MWMEACAGGPFPDRGAAAAGFSGPASALSYLGDTSIGAMAKGKAAISSARPTSRTTTPTSRRRPRDGQPARRAGFGLSVRPGTSPARRPGRLAKSSARRRRARRAVEVQRRTGSLLGRLGLVVPIMRERKEMGFTFDRPYRVESSKFARTFWPDPTPLEDGNPQDRARLPRRGRGNPNRSVSRLVPGGPASREPRSAAPGRVSPRPRNMR